MSIDRAILLSTPVTSFDEAKAFIDGLITLKLDFHFDDDPFTVHTLNATHHRDGRLFTDGEAVLVKQRLDEVYGFDFGDHGCPIGYVLDVTEPGWRTR